MYNGRRKEEPVGWKSEGMTSEKAYKIRAELLKDIESGYCISLKDRKFQNSHQRFLKENLLKEMDLDMNNFFNEKYLPYVQTKNRKSTWIREKYLFDKWLSPSFGLCPMSQISRDSLVRVLNTMQKAGQSNRSQNYAISLTRQIFNYAIENDFFDGKNPASKYKFPKEDNRRERYLSDEEVNQILEALKKRSYNMYLMALMAADCGLRAGEVFNLTWADINFKNKTLFLKNTKNHKDRYAYMTNRVYEELKNLPQQSVDKYLFQNYKGGKFEHVSRTFERVIKDLKLNDGITNRKQRVTFHVLRHYYASRLVKKNVPLIVVKELLGHSDIKMTMRYAHLNNEAYKDAISKLNEV